MLRFSAAVAAAGIFIGKLYYDSYTVGLIITILLAFYYPKYSQKIEKRRKNELLIEFRDLLYSISSSVSTGRNMKQALRESKEFWKDTYDDNSLIMTEVNHMLARMENSNENDIDCLRDFAEKSGLQDVSDFVSVYESCKETGGDLASAIARATTLIGDRISMESELNVLLAEKRLEGRIVAAAPFLMVLMTRLMSPGYMSVMTGNLKGVIISSFALLLTAASILMIERINEIEL